MTNGVGRAALEMRQVSKAYNALRPLRIASLSVAEGERVSIGGVDAGVGELLVNLMTGASVPDSGEIVVFGRRTADIANGDEWLDWLERFGIVSPRGVLLEGSTLLQNLAMPFTLEIEPVPAAIQEKVRALAVESGVDPERWLGVKAGDLPGDLRVRAHLIRSVELQPAFVIIEHPTADVPPGARQQLASDIARCCSARHLTAIILTNDEAFAKAVAPRNLTLHGATGELRPLRRGWFG